MTTSRHPLGQPVALGQARALQNPTAIEALNIEVDGLEQGPFTLKRTLLQAIDGASLSATNRYPLRRTMLWSLKGS